jgi:hypothetical protein
MASVYKNAHLTIALSGAKNSHEKILCAQEQGRTYKLDIGQSNTYLRPETLVRGEIYPNMWSTYELKGPLALRAWVLQEQILSPRVLQYTKEQLIWQCNTLSLCERDCRVKYRSPNDFVLPRLRTADDQHKVWRLLVHDFCSRRLTYGLDKLPTISGIAREFQNVSGDTWQECGRGIRTDNYSEEIRGRVKLRVSRFRRGVKLQVPRFRSIMRRPGVGQHLIGK